MAHTHPRRRSLEMCWIIQPQDLIIPCHVQTLVLSLRGLFLGRDSAKCNIDEIRAAWKYRSSSSSSSSQQRPAAARLVTIIARSQCLTTGFLLSFLLGICQAGILVKLRILSAENIRPQRFLIGEECRLAMLAHRNFFPPSLAVATSSTSYILTCTQAPA